MQHTKVLQGKAKRFGCSNLAIERVAPRDKGVVYRRKLATEYCTVLSGGPLRAASWRSRAVFGQHLQVLSNAVANTTR